MNAKLILSIIFLVLGFIIALLGCCRDAGGGVVNFPTIFLGMTLIVAGTCSAVIVCACELHNLVKLLYAKYLPKAVGNPKPLPTRPHDALGKEVVALGNNFSGILKEVRGDRGYIENSYGIVQDFPLSCIEQPY